MATEQHTDTRAAILALMDELGISISSVFVPWSKSRNYREDAKIWERSLNWKVSLVVNGRTLLTTDYSAGVAHCKSYDHRALKCMQWSLAHAACIERETETGRDSTWIDTVHVRGGHANPKPGAAVAQPDPVDVLYSLVQDGAAFFNYTDFEDWAADYGLDTDSRKAFTSYRECLEIGANMVRGVGGLGEVNFRRLQEALQDF